MNFEHIPSILRFNLTISNLQRRAAQTHVCLLAALRLLTASALVDGLLIPGADPGKMLVGGDRTIIKWWQITLPQGACNRAGVQGEQGKFLILQF